MKLRLVAITIAIVGITAACFLLSGCGGDYQVPTKIGGGGQSQPYLPAGNANGGQYIHLNK